MLVLPVSLSMSPPSSAASSSACIGHVSFFSSFTFLFLMLVSRLLSNEYVNINSKTTLLSPEVNDGGAKTY